MRLLGNYRRLLTAAAVGCLALSGCGTAATSSPPQQAPPRPDPTQTFNIASIEPDNGAEPLIDFINSARSTIDVVIYQFNDPQIKQSLINARRSGKRVRVLFSWQTYKSKNTYTNPASPSYNWNTPTFNSLRESGVEVAWSRPQFPYTHQKSVVLDAGTDTGRALIVDYNFQPHYLSSGVSPFDSGQSGTRGFGVTTSDRGVVDEMTKVFNADWPPFSKGDAYTNPNLVWSPTAPQFRGEPPGNSGVVLPRLITESTKTLDVYMYLSDNNDPQLNQVVDAARRGVKVRFVANCKALSQQDLERVKQAGVAVAFRPKSSSDASKFMFIHTKSLIADFGTDRQRGYVGSENIFLTQSLARLREAGAILTQSQALGLVHETFDRDFANSQPSCPPDSTPPILTDFSSQD